MPGERGRVLSAAVIRALVGADAEAYVAIRRQALLDAPLAFAASPGDDIAATADAVREQLARAPESMIFGAFDPQLTGVVGLYRDRHRKAAHKVHVWGMYVAPSHRGSGIAAALIQAALDHARALPGAAWVHITVSEAAPAARRLYERAGFTVWGTEPEALRHDGRSVVEHHMALRLA